MDEQPLQVRTFPQWKHAVQRVAAEFKPGDVITKEWLYGALEIEMPTDDTLHATGEQAKLQFVAAFDRMKKLLLEEYQIYLTNVLGVGYQWVLPQEQTDVACGDFKAEINKVLRKAARGLAYVRLDELTDQQRAANMNAQAKLGMFCSLNRKVRMNKVDEVNYQIVEKKRLPEPKAETKSA